MDLITLLHFRCKDIWLAIYSIELSLMTFHHDKKISLFADKNAIAQANQYENQHWDGITK